MIWTGALMPNRQRGGLFTPARLGGLPGSRRADGTTSARATAHGGYKNFKDSKGWGPWTGYYRVSGGSHAGHLVSGPTGERSTSKTELSLVPIETLPDKDLYHFAISPPWQKSVYTDPESPSS
jgi:hypothetical protein